MPEMKPNLTANINTNLAKVKPANILVFDKEISSVPDIVKLTVGEPDFNVPNVAKQRSMPLTIMTLTTLPEPVQLPSDKRLVISWSTVMT